MRIHNRSPTERNELHKDKQCKHTFEITAARCAPCGGYNVECKHYEGNDAADTAEAGLLFMWRGVSFWHRDIVSGAGPRLRLLNTFHESRARP